MGFNKTGWCHCLLVVGVLTFVLFSNSVMAQNRSIEELRNDYDKTKKAATARQLELKKQYDAARTDRERQQVIGESREFVFHTLTDSIFPAWYGTGWEFNGNTRTPGQGKIACGTFVVYCLQDVGFHIDNAMARQIAEYIIKNVKAETDDIKRFWNGAPMERVLQWVRGQGEGLFLVGLDCHVGFVIYKSGKITFCHSSYYDPPFMVVNQDVLGKSPLTDSAYRVLGKILDDQMMIKWLQQDDFPLTYDYFRRE